MNQVNSLKSLSNKPNETNFEQRKDYHTLPMGIASH